MTESFSGSRKQHGAAARMRRVCTGLGVGTTMVVAVAWAQDASSVPPLPTITSPARVAAVPFAAAPAIPRLAGRLGSKDIGLVINTADPYSVAVGDYYRQRRGLAPQQVLQVELPLRAQLTPAEFAVLQARVTAYFGSATQALALAWVLPYAVNCNALTGAMALGFDATLCEHSCRRSRPSPLFNSASARPWRDHHLRPAMHLAAPSVEAARQLIDRGVAADATLGRRGGATVRARYLITDDTARNGRVREYPPPSLLGRFGVAIEVLRVEASDAQAPLLLLQTGQAQLGDLPRQRWLPGALADHLTSFGGQLDGAGGQSSAMAWIAAGATASHGSASEPCAHLQKFPHPQVLLGHYLHGATAIEAYWKSVAWPQQSVFIGEPLAAPFAPPSAPPSRPAAPAEPPSPR